MNTKLEILNIYRHAKGLYESAERLARSSGVVRCSVCREIHPIGESHVGTPVTLKSLIVEHKPKKSNTE
ncbi:hypothetical protein LCGC14_2252390 [marine sediment metagenome]|uniref:Uncharacterized protein n=1 Tax=marine sediment metagenome TaxID=412755 RepID=A0A0F9D2H6_9ZZZZ